VSPADIDKLVSQLPRSNDPNILVGFETADDAGVYRLDDERALVQTLDFFPPVLDDPYDYGRVAAANSLSDVYAMGARPLSALAIVLIPAGSEWLEVLGTVMRGIADVCVEDEVALLGGHTQYAPEPTIGLSVTGVVHPDAVTSNAGAKPGDVLVLTKPIGTGILTTALKKGVLTADELEPLTKAMSTTNRRAAEAAVRHGAHSSTDVTGFGLLGHLNWMMRESGTTAVLRAGDVPLFPGTAERQAEGHVPGGSRRNLSFVQDTLGRGEGVDDDTCVRLADAQTSGGLVVALPPASVDAFLADLPGSAVIGEVRERENGVTIRLEA
jgi:selenide,water dikinase